MKAPSDIVSDVALHIRLSNEETAGVLQSIAPTYVPAGMGTTKA